MAKKWRSPLKIDKSIKGKIKWKIAQIVDKLFYCACWSRLIDWVYEIQSFRETFIDGGWKWKGCIKNNEAPFCGKCRQEFPERR